MGAKLAPAQGPYRLVVRMSRCGRDNPGSTPGEDMHDRGSVVDDLDFARHRLASMEELGTLQNLGRDDLEVFSTIKDPFGLETKSCSKSSRPIVLNVEAGAGVK